MHSAEFPIVIPIHFLDFDNAINCWFLSLLSFSLIFFLLWKAGRDPQMVPKGIQNFVELSIEFVQNLSEPLVGRHARFFFPLFFTIFFFIFFSNLMGLIPGSMSPTSRVDVNLGMALTIFLCTHFFGIKQKGFAKYFAHFLPPAIKVDPKASLVLKVMMKTIHLALCLMMPVIHLIGELVKPVSLTMRLFGNMMAKEKILAVAILLMAVFWGMEPFAKPLAVFPFLLRVFIVILGVFVSFVQAFVFMLLSMVYIGGAVQDHEEHTEGHEAEPAL